MQGHSVWEHMGVYTPVLHGFQLYGYLEPL